MVTFTGFFAAMATFLGVWLGHVLVRKVEARAVDLRFPVAVCVAAGFGLEFGALLAAWRPLSAALGILGMTVLWDAVEFYRQEKRVRLGRAPARLDNPRHARILATCPAATHISWLDQDPRGHQLTPDELQVFAARFSGMEG